VVANRAGGITKVWARPEYCEDKNGNGMIDTSSGKFDVKPFDAEECIAWYTPFPGATTQRPVAWTSGVYNTTTCEYDDQKVWTAASYGQGSECGGADGIYVYRLNGDTGVVEDTVHLPNVSCGALGAYGAAVDAQNNVWFFVFGGGVIFRVDYATLAYQVVNNGFYGITVDTKSRVWLDNGQRYDPVAGTWASPIGNYPTSGGSGVVQDLQGRIWNGRSGAVGWLDADTMVVGDQVNLPEQTLMRGVGVDVDGFIWAVPLSGTRAYRIHPDTYEVVSYDGLNSPYTYSDMAGGQINNVVCPQ
jgi:streptogramin lyase